MKVINVFAVLCFCVGVCLLWIDPHNTIYKLIFYICCAGIPVGLLSYKNWKEAKEQNRKLVPVGITLGGLTILLGVLTAYMILAKSYEEHTAAFISLAVLCAISLVSLVVWNRRSID